MIKAILQAAFAIAIAAIAAIIIYSIIMFGPAAAFDIVIKLIAFEALILVIVVLAVVVIVSVATAIRAIWSWKNERTR